MASLLGINKENINGAGFCYIEDGKVIPNGRSISLKVGVSSMCSALLNRMMKE